MEHFDSTARYVIRGAALLDRYVPNWYNRVDVESLNIYSGDDCVLAQVFGRHYSHALNVLVVKGATHVGVGNAYRFGFNTRGGNGDDLAHYWRYQIDARRMEAEQNAESPLADWEREILAGHAVDAETTTTVATAVFTRTDGATVTLTGVNPDSIGPAAERPGVIGVEYADGSDRITHLPFIESWEISYS